MRANSQDLRERVVRACDEGLLSRPQTAALFDASAAWIHRLLQHHSPDSGPHWPDGQKMLQPSRQDRPEVRPKRAPPSARVYGASVCQST